MESGTLIVADGDLPALLACAAASRDSARKQRSVVAWIPPQGLEAGPERIDAARCQADLYGLSLAAGGAMREGTGQGWDASVCLLLACQAAALGGIRSVIWTVHAGPELDLDRVSRAVDRCLLVTRLAGIDHGEADAGGPIEVHAPYADLTDDQIADLVIDMDLPVRTCWWWEPRTPAARAARERWGRALARAGWLDLGEPAPGASPVGRPPAPAPV